MNIGLVIAVLAVAWFVGERIWQHLQKQKVQLRQQMAPDTFGFLVQKKMGRRGDLERIVRIIVLLSLFFAALYVILIGDYPLDTQKWAYSVSGSVLGYIIKSDG